MKNNFDCLNFKLKIRSVSDQIEVLSENLKKSNDEQVKTEANDSLPTVFPNALELKFPIFDETRQHYKSFIDVFHELVNNNDTLAKMRKFHLLKMSLQEKTARAVADIEFKAGNYKEDNTKKKICLEKHFNDATKTFHDLINKLLSLKSMSRGNMDHVWHIYEKVRHHRWININIQQTDTTSINQSIFLCFTP